MKHLERQVRVLQRRTRLLGLALGGLGLVFVLGAAQEPVPAPVPLRCTSLELVDGAGAVLARLGVDADGAAGLFLVDAEGRDRAALVHDASQTGLFVLDDEDTVRIGVAQFAHGGGGVALHGAESKGAAVLYYKDAGSLAFYAADGELVERVPEGD